MDSSTVFHMEDIQDGVMPRLGEHSSQGTGLFREDSWQDRQEDDITIIESVHCACC